jgi:nitrite reductase/ring-hydroxylating ferredoxin subunit
MVRYNSKLLIFLLFTTIGLLSASCNKDDHEIIPYSYVDFYIGLNDVEFDVLNAPGNHIITSNTTLNNDSRALGFDNNGIIVYRASLDEFFAFDRTCPHEYSTNSASIAVNVPGMGDLTAICPECGSEYVLPSFGNPSKTGPSKYPLKNYKVHFSGDYLHIYNW